MKLRTSVWTLLLALLVAGGLSSTITAWAVEEEPPEEVMGITDLWLENEVDQDGDDRIRGALLKWAEGWVPLDTLRDYGTEPEWVYEEIHYRQIYDPSSASEWEFWGGTEPHPFALEGASSPLFSGIQCPGDPGLYEWMVSLYEGENGFDNKEEENYPLYEDSIKVLMEPALEDIRPGAVSPIRLFLDTPEGWQPIPSHGATVMFGGLFLNDPPAQRRFMVKNVSTQTLSLAEDVWVRPQTFLSDGGTSFALPFTLTEVLEPSLPALSEDFFTIEMGTHTPGFHSANAGFAYGLEPNLPNSRTEEIPESAFVTDFRVNGAVMEENVQPKAVVLTHEAGTLTTVTAGSGPWSLGSASVGSLPLKRAFKVVNGGSAPLRTNGLGIVDITGSRIHDGQFGIIDHLEPELAPGDSDLVVVELLTDEPGQFMAEWFFFSNDPGMTTFTCTVEGFVDEVNDDGPIAWVMDVDEDYAHIPNHGGPAYFGWHNVGDPEPLRTFKVENAGMAPLEINNLIVGPYPTEPGRPFTTHTLPFSVVEGLTTGLMPGEWDTFEIKMQTAYPGAFNGVVSFETNDPAAPRYTFSIEGDVSRDDPVEGPVMRVVNVDFNHHEIFNGDGPLTFGSTPPNVPLVRTFKVFNEGTAPLEVGVVDVFPLDEYLREEVEDETPYHVVNDLDTVIQPGGWDTFQIALKADVHGVYLCEVEFENNTPEDDPFFFSLIGRVEENSTLSPEVAVVDVDHNHDDIPLGAMVPFHNADSTGAYMDVRTFKVLNLGAAPLHTANLRLEPMDGAGDPYREEDEPGLHIVEGLDEEIAPGEWDHFQIGLTRSEWEHHAAKVIFENNDWDEDPFYFSLVLYDGPAPEGPEMEVYLLQQEPGEMLPVFNGDGPFFLGAKPWLSDMVLQKSFKVVNVGDGDLLTTHLTAPPGFTITDHLRPVLGPGEEDLFSLEFDAPTTGTFGGMVKFGCNAFEEGPFHFFVEAALVQMHEGPPFLVGTRTANGFTTLTQDGILEIGELPLSSAGWTKTFEVINKGRRPLQTWNLHTFIEWPDSFYYRDGSEDDGEDFRPFLAFEVVEGLKPVLMPGERDSFTLFFDTNVYGLYEAVVGFGNSNMESHPFAFGLEMEVVAPHQGAVIKVLQGGEPLPHAGSVVDFGEVLQGSPEVLRAFKVLNVGNRELKIGDLYLDGVHHIMDREEEDEDSGFEIVEGLDEVIAPGEWGRFVVAMKTEAIGFQEALLVLVHNDYDHTPFEILLEGHVKGENELPKVEVWMGEEMVGPDTQSQFLGSAAVGDEPVTQTFLVKNVGNAPLFSGDVVLFPAVSIDDDKDDDRLWSDEPDYFPFHVVKQLEREIPAGGEGSFTLALGTDKPGRYDAMVKFFHNSVVQNPTFFFVHGEVEGEVVMPEMAVLDGETIILDGDGPILMHEADSGALKPQVSKTFTVRNLGEAPLRTYGLRVRSGYVESDDRSSDDNPITAYFKVSEELDHVIPARGADTFTITLSAPVSGVYTGSVFFDHNAANPSPFSFTVKGAVSGEATQANLKVFDKGSRVFLNDLVNFGATSNGEMVLKKTFTILNSGDINLTIGEIVVPEGFEVTQQPFSNTIPPRGSEDFSLEVDAESTGVLKGQVSFETNVPQKNPFVFEVLAIIQDPSQGNHPPMQPHNILPPDGATDISLTPTLHATPFHDRDPLDRHYASRWRVFWGNETNVEAYPAFDSGVTARFLDTLPLPSGVVTANKKYSWRVQYQDNKGGWSPWSETTHFYTRSEGSPPSAPMDLTARAGAHSVVLKWHPNTEAGIAGYRVYRDSAESGDFASLLNQELVRPPRFVDTAVSPGESWYYKVRAVNRFGVESALSSPAQVTVGQVQVWMPDYRGPAGSTVTLAVNCSNARGILSNGVDVRLTYDANLLTPLGVSPSYLTRRFNFYDNSSVASGQLNISGISATSHTLRGWGRLLNVHFLVNADADEGTTASHAFTSVTLFDRDANPLAVDFSDTALFTVAAGYDRGDVNGDGEVNSGDALLALLASVGARNLHALAFNAADMNGDGLLTPADITLILRLSVGLPLLPQEGSGSSSIALTRAEGDPRTLYIPDSYGVTGSLVDIPVYLTDTKDIAGIEFQMNFDDNVLTLEEVLAGSDTADFSLEYQTAGDYVRVSLSNSTALTGGEGEVAVVRFRVDGMADEQTNLSISDVNLSGAYGEDLSWSEDIAVSDGSFTVSSGEDLQAPGVPANPTPATNGTGVSNQPQFDWDDASGATSYDFYLWADGFTGLVVPLVTDLTASEYNLDFELPYLSVYNWQVVAKNSFGETPGAVWKFTVETAPSATQWLNDFGANQGWDPVEHPRMLADVNGDGLDDILGFADAGVMVALSTGEGFSSSTIWIDNFGYNDYWRTANHPRKAADLNNDGLADVLGFGDKGIMVALSTGSGFTEANLWVPNFGREKGWRVDTHPRLLGDVNGDDKLDVVGFGNKGVLVATYTSDTFSDTHMWLQDFGSEKGWTIANHPRQLADMNGDGLDDVIGFANQGVMVALSSGSDFGAPSLWARDFGRDKGWNGAQYPRQFVDLNGDSLLDVCGFGNKGVFAALSDGSQFGSADMWLSEAYSYDAGWRVTDHVRYFGDLDGDGKSDIIGCYENGVWISISQGDYFMPPAFWASDFGTDQGWDKSKHLRLFGHVDGDNTLDIVGFYNDGVYVY